MTHKFNDIVVVDDNPAVLYMFSEIFKQQRYSVRTAYDGFSALALIRDRVPDVLLSDLNMPRMSGFELLSVVRRRFPKIAVIAMSGAYSGEAIPNGVAADGFYAKGSYAIACLFEILRAIEDDTERDSSRALAPLWIPGLPAYHGDVLRTSVACPECLRTFVHPLHDDARLAGEESHCPHCMIPVRLALVRQSSYMDRTAACKSVLGKPTGESVPQSHSKRNIYTEYSQN